MINVTRQTNVPASLTTAEIQQYITNITDHMADPVNVPDPGKPPSYRSSDLLDAFDSNFYSKCYLTEQKYTNSYPMDVEHFIGKAERPDLIHEWTNLFPAERIANMIKPRRTPAGGYLNPCDPHDDVETEIIYTLSTYGFDPQFSPSNTSNNKAVNTCNLLDRVHNGHDDNTKNLTADLRHSIHKKYVEILNKIAEWQHYAAGSPQKNQAERELRDLLSRKNSFTMLCRSMPAVINYVPRTFLD